MKSVPLTVLAYSLGIVFSLMTFYMIYQVFSWSLPAGLMVIASLGAIVWYVIGDDLIGDDPSDTEPVDSYSKVFLPSEARDIDLTVRRKFEEIQG